MASKLSGHCTEVIPLQANKLGIGFSSTAVAMEKESTKR